MRLDIVRAYRSVHTRTIFLLFIAFYAGALPVFRDAVHQWASPPRTERMLPLEKAQTLIVRTLERHPEVASNTWFMGIVAMLYTLALVSGVVLLLPSLVKDFCVLRVDRPLRRMWMDAPLCGYHQPSVSSGYGLDGQRIRFSRRHIRCFQDTLFHNGNVAAM